MTEDNTRTGERYLIQLSIKKDSFMFNMWDYVESTKTLKEAEKLCEGLYDKTVHKLQISDLVTNTIVKTWT
tara:strand:+ start:407 stop:619 length:213 start_codon:yes stop_codon:yes gene_type:complete